MQNLKKVLPVLIIVFAVYVVLAQPEKAADMVRSAFDGLAAGGHSVKRFFDALVA
jgi:hypothetical protein